MKEAKSQADKRRSVIAKDQFGRPWNYSFELETGDPAGPINPCGWTDPMPIPQKYISVPKNEYDFPDLGKVVLDVKRWAKDQSAALEVWMEAYYTHGHEHYESAFRPKEMLEDRYLLRVTGQKPKPTRECIDVLSRPEHNAHEPLLGLAPMTDIARRLLGQDPEARRAIQAAGAGLDDSQDLYADEKLTIMQFLATGPSYREFVGYGTKVHGWDLTEVAERWKEYKALAGLGESGIGTPPPPAETTQQETAEV